MCHKSRAAAQAYAIKYNLPPSLRLTLYTMADIARNGIAFPSVGTLAEITGKSNRQIKRDISQLLTMAPPIIKTADRSGGRGKTPVYNFILKGDTHDTLYHGQKGDTHGQKGDTHGQKGDTHGQKGDTHDTRSYITYNNHNKPSELINEWIKKTSCPRPTEREIQKAQDWYDSFNNGYDVYGDDLINMMLSENRGRAPKYRTNDPIKLIGALLKKSDSKRENGRYTINDNGSF